MATLRKGLLLVHAASIRPQQWAAQSDAPQAPQESPVSNTISGYAQAPERQPHVDMQMPSAEPGAMHTASGPVHQEAMQAPIAAAATHASDDSAATLPNMIGPEA